MNIINNLSPIKREWFSIIFTVVLAEILTIIGIYGIREYGMALFILTPILIGFCPTILFDYQNKELLNKSTSLRLAFVTLSVYFFSLVIFAFEGLICIIMALPIGLAFTWCGSLIALGIVNRKSKNGPPTLLLLILLIPSLSFYEKTIKANVEKVTTEIIIYAPIEEVWKNVVVFPQLEEPTEFIFKTGISYPINATIKGKGVGAIRYCNFTTGSFVEPITKWDEPNLLQFDVLKQPIPMKELSLWDIDAPHLHGYFVSQKGQFKLVKLGKNKTKLIGSTWYFNNIKPNFYWNIWSSNIIHKIHERVLKHIKKNAEG